MRFLSILLCYLFFGSVLAQQKSGVKLLAKVKDGSILLRWAPTNSLTWLQANQKGYLIERYLITKKNELIKKPEKILLTSSPLKPKLLEQWRSEIEKNKYSAVAAQAIYGSSFQVTLPQNGNITEIVNRSKEQEQRFSFALFAADHSFQTAKLSALGFKDSTVNKNERYLYRVYVANTDPRIKLDTGMFYLGLQDTVGLVPPMNLTAQFADRIVLLKWPKSLVQQTYTSFVIERSEAGGDFIKRNSAPYVNTSSGSEAEMFFQALDSLPENGVEYQYRIRGITHFGEIGPESERVAGRGFEALDAKASITEAKEKDGQVQIQWRVIGNSKKIRGHFVERASDVGKNFQRLNEMPLDREVTSYVDLTPQSSGYYRVRVTGDNGQSSTSFPVLVQLVDSIPPTQPQGLNVKVDTTGVAWLTWQFNQESDLFGYKIYRSNFLNAEFSELNHSAISTNSYVDSVNIKTLNTKVFYKLAAFDKRMNRSTYSEVVEAALPDIIPPQPPVIKEIRPESNGIFIAWTPSSSDDVQKYRLERRAGDSVQWNVVKIFDVKDSSLYKDGTAISQLVYFFRMFAIDKNGLKSIASNSVAGQTLLKRLPLSVEDISAIVDRENKTIRLQWKYETQAVKFLIYRAAADEQMSLHEAISGSQRSYENASLNINTTYRYRIKAVSTTGESRFSKTIEIKF